MEVLAAPARATVWLCPECGHGSSDPRDEQAHLDAHRQLQQFFREWDDAVVSDARAVTSHSRWRPPRVWGLALLIVCLAGLLLATVAGRDGAPSRPTAPGVPIPGVDLPRYDTPDVAPDPTAPVGGPVPVQAPSPPATGPADSGSPSQAARPPSVAPPVEAAPGAAVAVTAPSATDSDAGAAALPIPVAPDPTTAPATHLVDTCLLGLVCITVL